MTLKWELLTGRVTRAEGLEVTVESRLCGLRSVKVVQSSR